MSSALDQAVVCKSRLNSGSTMGKALRQDAAAEQSELDNIELDSRVTK